MSVEAPVRPSHFEPAPAPGQLHGIPVRAGFSLGAFGGVDLYRSPSPRPAEMPIGEHPAVIVVDDDPEDVELLCLALAEIGIGDAVALEGGRPLLDHLSRLSAGERRDRVVLLDLGMPGLSGIETLAAMHEESVDEARVIVVSGCEEDESIWIAERMGASGYIVKPPTPQALESVMSGIGTYDFSVVPLSESAWGTA